MRGTPTSLTGSRRLDIVLFVLGLLVLCGAGLRLRVYHEVTIVDVAVVEVAPDGTRTPVATPEALLRPGAGTWPATEVEARAGALIAERVPEWRRFRSAAAGTRFEITVRWAEDSTALVHRTRFIVPVPER